MGFAEVKKALRMALALLLGEHCVMCGRSLPGAGICPTCWLCLPYTYLGGKRANPLERLFWSEPNVDRVNAYTWYKPEYAIARLVHAFKYYGRCDLARQVGQLMARDLVNTDFFDGIDALVPVPLSRERLRQRGYNQSEMIAYGVTDITHIPVRTDYVIRTIDNPSQTTLTPSARHANVADIFTLCQPEFSEDKLHLLVIDDVITVGATLMSLARTFREMEGVTLSFLTFCAAGQYRSGRISPQDVGLPDETAVFDPTTLRRYRPRS